MQVSKITEADIVFVRDNPDSYESYLFNKNCQYFAYGIIKQRFPKACAFNRDEVAADCVWQAYKNFDRFLSYKKSPNSFVKWYRSICHRRLNAYVRDNFGAVWNDAYCFNEAYYLDKFPDPENKQTRNSATFEMIASFEGVGSDVDLMELVEIARSRTLLNFGSDYASESIRMSLEGWTAAEIARKFGISREMPSRFWCFFKKELTDLIDGEQ